MPKLKIPSRLMPRLKPQPLPYVITDGGRADAGIKGRSGDCVVRAIGIAAERPYTTVLEELAAYARVYAYSRRDRTSAALVNQGADPLHGSHRKVYEPYIFALGFKWTATMYVGSGCQVHLRKGDLPNKGRLIVQVSKYLVAVINGEVHDNHDPARFGTRCVYGYYSKV